MRLEKGEECVCGKIPHNFWSNQTRIKLYDCFACVQLRARFLEWIFLVCHLENNLRGPARSAGTNGLCVKCVYSCMEML